MPEFTTVPSKIRPMLHSDLELVLSWRNHPDIRRYMFTQNEIAFDEHKRWFECAKADLKRHLLIFEVAHLPLGFVHFTETGSGGIADWGFYAAHDAPKGTGQLLGIAALNHAFTQIGLHKVCGQALSYNKRSINFHLALGFKQEGILRDQHFDGELYHHVTCLGLLGSEWQPAKLTFSDPYEQST